MSLQDFNPRWKCAFSSKGWQLPAVLSLLQSPALVCHWLGSEVSSRGTGEACRSPGSAVAWNDTQEICCFLEELQLMCK